MIRAALLAALATVSLAACAGTSAGDRADRGASAPQVAREQVETLTATELAALVAAGKVVLIDVRTPYEFADGRIAGSLNAPLTHFDPAAIPLDPTRETILYCASARRSLVAAEQLAAHTGGPVRHLEGGLAAWEDAGLAIVANVPEDDPREE